MKLSLIVAVSSNGVIGREGRLPWRLSADLRRFKSLTMGHVLIMGRKTWESIGRPLPGRRIFVLTRQEEYRIDAEGVGVAHSLDELLGQLAADEEVFVAGGAEIYRLAAPRASKIYLTRVHALVEGDTVFPEPDSDAWECISSEDHRADEKNEWDYSFLCYRRRRETLEGEETRREQLSQS